MVNRVLNAQDRRIIWRDIVEFLIIVFFPRAKWIIVRRISVYICNSSRTLVN